MARRITLIAFSIIAVLTASVIAAGCGAMTKSEYIKQVTEINASIDKAGDPFGGSGDPSPAAVRKQQKAVKKAAADMDEMTPPEKIAKTHDRYVKALRAFADNLGTIADAIEDSKGDQAMLGEKMADLQTKMQKDTAELGKVVDQYKKLGYGKVADGVK